MKRPSLLHWVYRWFWITFFIFAIIAAGLVIVNLVDAYPYWRALHRIRALDQPTLRMIAELCTKREQGGHQQLKAADIPPELRFLKPVRVSFYPGSSDIALLEPDDSCLGIYPYIFLRVSTHAENQTIIAVAEAYRGQNSKLLWEKNPAFSQQFCFNNRMVTLTQIDMHRSHDWIFLPGELVVLDHSYPVSQGPKISKRISLTTAQQEKLKIATSCIDSEIRGRVYDAGGSDGITLRISFAPDGSLKDGVVLANVWRKEVTPLIESLISILGEEESYEIQNMVEWLTDPTRNDHVLTSTIKEYQERRANSPLPWWRLWPRFDLFQNKSP